MCFMRQNDSRVGHFLSPRRQSRVFYDAPAFFVFFNMIKKPRTRVFYEAPAFFVLFQYDKKAANLCVLRWSSVFRFFSIYQKNRENMWKQRRKSFSVFFQHHKKAANPCVLRGPGVFFITRFFSWKSRNRVFYIPSATFFFLKSWKSRNHVFSRCLSVSSRHKSIGYTFFLVDYVFFFC